MDAEKIIEQAEKDKQKERDLLRPVAEWFHDNEGELFTRQDAVDSLKDELDEDDGELLHRVVANLATDRVDPVQNVVSSDGKYVGVIEYDEHKGWYEYTEAHDVDGRKNIGICAKCVEDGVSVTDVAKGSGTTEELSERIGDHYDQEHSVYPEDVETGATLVSGTTIDGNLAIHLGNDGPGSGLDADTVDGNQPADIATTYDDGTIECYVTSLSRFGAEGSSTTSTSYTTIAGSDITFNPDDFRNSSGDLYIRVFGHLKHSINSGDALARVYRQNAATAVSGTTLQVTANDDWGVDDTGWVSLADSGYDSYQLQIRSSDGESVSYNSVLLFFGVPV